VADPETLARIYSDALLELAFEKGAHAEVLAELRDFVALLAKEPEFDAFLGTPSIRPNTKKAVLESVFGGQVSEITMNFLKVIVDRRRQDVLQLMVRTFENGYHDRMGEVVVGVNSAVSLSDAQRSKLLSLLKSKLEKEIVLEERVDTRLLGGLVIRVGDRRIDGSLKSRLESVGASLEGLRLHSEDYYEN
jgi:F-type H+-transporting ATPase subunit delta